MEENFVSYDLAVKLKELRFIEPCFAVWYKSSSDGYSLQVNPLKLDDIYAIEPLATFQNNVNRVDAMDSIIKYNFNEFFDDVDAEGNKFDPVYSAPSYQQVQKWLREVHGIHINITYCGEHEDGHPALRVLIIKGVIKLDCTSPIEGDNYIFRTYEQALEVAILESLKLIKDEN
jgi:hypothetical protein